jgi:hypothetical protein
MLTKDSIGRDYVLKTGTVITIIAEIPEREFKFAGYSYENGVNSRIFFWNAEGEFESPEGIPAPQCDIQNQVVALPFTVH